MTLMGSFFISSEVSVLSCAGQTERTPLQNDSRCKVTDTGAIGCLASSLGAVCHGENGPQTLRELARGYLSISKDLKRVRIGSRGHDGSLKMYVVLTPDSVPAGQNYLALS